MQKKEIEKLKKIEKIAALSSKTKEEVLAEIKKFLFDLESYIHLENVLKRVHSRRASDYEPNTIPYQMFVDLKNRVVYIKIFLFKIFLSTKDVLHRVVGIIKTTSFMFFI